MTAVSVYNINVKRTNMLKGDISNSTCPRIALVFEGALGHISGQAVEEFNELASSGAWTSAWRCWTLNDMMCRKIWDVVIRQSIQVTVVTLLVPQEFRDAARDGLQDRIDDHRLPVSEVLVLSAEELSREIAYMPDLVRVYDANPETWGMYGRKGHALRNVNDFGRL